MNHLSHIHSAPHAMGIHGLGATQPQHQQIKTLSQKLVSQAFYGTLLKQMHDSPFKSSLFEGGRGGQMFGSMLDQQLADRMAGSSANGLADAMAKRIEQHAHGHKNPPASGAKTAAHRRTAKHAYLKAPAKTRSDYVPAHFRA